MSFRFFESDRVVRKQQKFLKESARRLLKGLIFTTKEDVVNNLNKLKEREHNNETDVEVIDMAIYLVESGNYSE